MGYVYLLSIAKVIGKKVTSLSELDNAVKLTNEDYDSLYKYDSTSEHHELSKSRPWKTDPHYFTHIHISAVALLKMVMHARSGGEIEIMGLMQGYVLDKTFVVTDAFRLPVEGTETRVNAQESANEYMVAFDQAAQAAGQEENVVGWYHSHPGYGCWLSGIDVGTQHTQQMWQDPFVAVVIDPDRTITSGKVDIGAFRTYPENYKPPAAGDSGSKEGGPSTDSEGFQTIPLAKVDDFGAHSARYYPLEISHFKSTLDNTLLEALWNKYWVDTVAASPLFTNHEYVTKQISELSRKMEAAEGFIKESRSNASVGRGGDSGERAGSSRGYSSSMVSANTPDSHPSRPRRAIRYNTFEEAVKSVYGSFPKLECSNPDKRNKQGIDDVEELNRVVLAGRKIAAEEEAGLMARRIKEKLFNGLGSAVAGHGEQAGEP